jgi:hypothetical protein
MGKGGGMLKRKRERKQTNVPGREEAAGACKGRSEVVAQVLERPCVFGKVPVGHPEPCLSEPGSGRLGPGRSGLPLARD